MPIRLNSPFRTTDILPSHRRSTTVTACCNFFRSSPAGRLVVGTILVWGIAFVFCRHAFWRDPHSWFFDGSRAYEFEYTDHRREEARGLIAIANDTQDSSPVFAKSNNEPVICAGMVTVKRRGVQYLEDTLGSMLAGLTPEERSAIEVRLLFANTTDSAPQAPHPDYNKPWLDLLDAWGPYNVSEMELEILKEYQRNDTYRPKWIFDYTHIMEQCYNETSAPYIAVLEDDIVFADGWLPKTLHALGRLRYESTVWLYLRLFYTESQLGWDRGVDRWNSNPIFSFFLAMGLCCLAALAIRLACKRWRPDISHANHASVAVVTWITVPAFVILLFLIGVDSLIPRHADLERMDTKGCCNQALIYPRSQVPNVMAMLRESKPGPTDWMIENWANELNLARYAVSPPVVQHVGLVSSRGMPKRYAKETWAYAFEGQSAKRLRKEHQRMAMGGIWRAEDEGPILRPP